MKTHRSERRREKHKARVKFLKIQNLTIEPQSTEYSFVDGSRPTRIGDIAEIIIEPDFAYFMRAKRVILLADESGRRWLVSCA